MSQIHFRFPSRNGYRMTYKTSRIRTYVDFENKNRQFYDYRSAVKSVNIVRVPDRRTRNL